MLIPNWQSYNSNKTNSTVDSREPTDWVSERDGIKKRRIYIFFRVVFFCIFFFLSVGAFGVVHTLHARVRHARFIRPQGDVCAQHGSPAHTVRSAHATRWQVPRVKAARPRYPLPNRIAIEAAQTKKKQVEQQSLSLSMLKSIKQEEKLLLLLLLLSVLLSLLTFTMTMASINDREIHSKRYEQYQDRSGFLFAQTHGRTNEWTNERTWTRG